MNNGKGIPVVFHKTEQMYVPELIFGTLLTSSNYDDSEKKVTGGRNGFGAKLCNIFSKEFTLETSYIHNGKSFKQVSNHYYFVKIDCKVNLCKTISHICFAGGVEGR